MLVVIDLLNLQLNGQYNNESIIPKSVTTNSYDEIVDLYETLHNITTTFEAQATLTNNTLGSALSAVLESVEDDACAMVSTRLASNIITLLAIFGQIINLSSVSCLAERNC